ncbi:MAG TPA: hypothetical protein ENJ99_04875, partial [Rhizobiales bacterium]|nr:hypothetical protein [Hyphomicrobiales bacterium]
MEAIMYRFASLFIFALALFTISPNVSGAEAGELLEVYRARLGTDDHFNSRGQRLDNAAAIIRQDRANFHRFGIRDDEDQGDSYFASKANRARLERMLRRGRATRSVLRQIVNGTPMIRVRIYS